MDKLTHIGDLIGGKPEIPTFEQWWQQYPKGRRQGKKKAEPIWNKLTDIDKCACLVGTARHVEHNPQWTDPQYVPMPTTFLNQQRWNDELVITRKEEAAETAAVGDNSDKVWSFMIEFYGERWVKENGPKPGELWRKFLKPLPEARIKRGMRQVLDRNTEYMPSLPAFIAYCKPTFGEQHPNKALPRPEGDPALADEAFATLKKTLGI